MFKTTYAALAAALVFGTAGSAFAVPEKPECVAPAKPGGGFDLTCKLVQSALQNGNYLPNPMRVTYMPGGIGAVAYNTVIAQRPAGNSASPTAAGNSASGQSAPRWACISRRPCSANWPTAGC